MATSPKSPPPLKSHEDDHPPPAVGGGHVATTDAPPPPKAAPYPPVESAGDEQRARSAEYEAMGHPAMMESKDEREPEDPDHPEQRPKQVEGVAPKHEGAKK